MDQILQAQKTMGGRVVQKYVETPLLFRRFPPLSADPDGRKPPLVWRSRSNEMGQGLESCRRSRRWLEKKGRSQHQTSKFNPPTRRHLSSSEAEVDSTTSDRGTAAPFDKPLHGLQEDGSRCPGDKLHTSNGVDPEAEATKFDLRIWVLVTSWDPMESFLYDQCYLRVCPRRFTLAESKFGDPDVHLTNLCLRRPVDSTPKAVAPFFTHARCRRRNKRPFSASRTTFHAADRQCDGVGKRGDGFTNRFANDEERTCGEEWHVDEGGGGRFVASQAELIQRLGEVDNVDVLERLGKGRDGLTQKTKLARGKRLWQNKVLPSIERIVKSTLVAANFHVRPRKQSFQLFGFDLLLDRDLNPCKWEL